MGRVGKFRMIKVKKEVSEDACLTKQKMYNKHDNRQETFTVNLALLNFADDSSSP